MLTIKTSALRAAMLFAAKRDIRSYLNAVQFVVTSAGYVIHATDGHRLIEIQGACEVSGPMETSIIIPRDALERFLKLAGKSEVCTLENAGNLYSLRTNDVCVGTSDISARYPEFDLFFGAPLAPLGDVPVNSDYLADFCAAAKLIGGKSRNLIIEGQRREAIYCSTRAGSVSAAMLVMPLRRTEKAPLPCYSPIEPTAPAAQAA